MCVSCQPRRSVHCVSPASQGDHFTVSCQPRRSFHCVSCQPVACCKHPPPPPPDSCCWLLTVNMSQQHASAVAETILRAATLRWKRQIKLAISPNHSTLTPGRQVPSLRRYNGRQVATGGQSVSVVGHGMERHPQGQWGWKPGVAQWRGRHTTGLRRTPHHWAKEDAAPLG